MKAQQEGQEKNAATKKNNDCISKGEGKEMRRKPGTLKKEKVGQLKPRRRSEKGRFWDINWGRKGYLRPALKVNPKRCLRSRDGKDRMGKHTRERQTIRTKPDAREHLSAGGVRRVLK